jgi:hypothetical protein
MQPTDLHRSAAIGPQPRSWPLYPTYCSVEGRYTCCRCYPAYYTPYITYIASYFTIFFIYYILRSTCCRCQPAAAAASRSTLSPSSSPSSPSATAGRRASEPASAARAGAGGGGGGSGGASGASQGGGEPAGWGAGERGGEGAAAAATAAAAAAGGAGPAAASFLQRWRRRRRAGPYTLRAGAVLCPIPQQRTLLYHGNMIQLAVCSSFLSTCLPLLSCSGRRLLRVRTASFALLCFSTVGLSAAAVVQGRVSLAIGRSLLSAFLPLDSLSTQEVQGAREDSCLSRYECMCSDSYRLGQHTNLPSVFCRHYCRAFKQTMRRCKNLCNGRKRTCPAPSQTR